MYDMCIRTCINIVGPVWLAPGRTFYSYSEGWHAIDAAYFAVVTLTTVGYGDLHPIWTPRQEIILLLPKEGIGG